MTKTITFSQWQQQAQALRLRADKISKQIVDGARVTAEKAGLDPQMPFLHAHNALCSFEYGKPWAGVNYSLARKVLWLEQKSFEPHRLVDAINKRAWDKMNHAVVFQYE